MCSIEIERFDEYGKSVIIEKSSNGDLLEVAFDFDLVEILLGYPRYGEDTMRLHWHRWKVKNSSLPA